MYCFTAISKRISRVPFPQPRDLFNLPFLGRVNFFNSLKSKTHLHTVNPLTFLLSSSETQAAEESLSHTNAALKQVTVELQSAKQELQAVVDTKDSVTKELNDLQLTLAGNEYCQVIYSFPFF